MKAAVKTDPIAERAGAILSLEDVAVARAGRRVIAGVSLVLNPGAAIIFKGPNGSGKTTLLRAIAGLLPIIAGRIDIRTGADVASSVADRRAHVVHCGHLDGVKAPMTVGENIAFWALLYGAPRGRIDEALRLFDLGALAPARAADLSAGQRRRLCLARLVVSGRPIWLLDEPTASMDAASVARLIDLIGAHRMNGGSLIVATHDKIAIDGARSYVLEPVAV
ncbi:MAG: heme ABC exporter ATP-binding protein CcmA [Parvularculaceae bacterium]